MPVMVTGSSVVSQSWKVPAVTTPVLLKVTVPPPHKVPLFAMAVTLR